MHYPCSLSGELDRIKENIENLNSRVKHQCYQQCQFHQCPAEQAPVPEQTKPALNHTVPIYQGKTVSFGKDQAVRDTTAKFNDDNENVMRVPYNPFAKKRTGDPRLLNDKQVRDALTFPNELLGEKTTAVQVMRRSL